ncbi:MAG TPA: sulfatase-like hydrolase/transferase [Chloroflexota bacterium]|nr:sulfatase-like hydrolase/transferase [Chloroflexota bacterium]
MPSDTRPNVLIFMTDQEQADVMRPDHPARTPNADRLAKEGVTFTSMYCPSPHCCPSRATLMTGVYPSIHGIFNNVSNPTAINTALRQPGGRPIPMWSEAMKEAGYRMQYSGKWHVSAEEDPGDRGWEELLVTGQRRSRVEGVRDRERWLTMAPDAPSDAPRPRGLVRRPGWGDYTLYRTVPAQTPLGYDQGNDWRVVSTGLGALEKLVKQPSDQPWCLYVGPVGPHDPYGVPETFVKRYDPTQVELPVSFHDTMADKPRIYQRMRRQYWDQLSEDEHREAVAHYYAYCEMEDTYLGLLLDVLDSSGRREDTLVLRLSDHGDYAAAHSLYCKGVPSFREAYNVPCIVSGPGIANPGRTEDSFVSLADIHPTMLELVGAEQPADTHVTGRSMLPFLRGERPEDWPDAFYSQLNGVELYYTQRIVQTKEWKYVYNGFDFDELYDLRADPHETTNLLAAEAGTPASRMGNAEHRQVARDLVRKMWRFAERTNDQVFNPYATVAMAPWGPAEALRQPPVPPAKEQE